ncbi:accessory Sec system glycosyltransferase GtfA [Staphylococcus edaphicus]|uniref:UDP-N-acetylglucosamine--peptide N-acetylglucosaminyltransferase GtfA subunit n=1 Tax=Staphylococcus edaphicus TaxID=1955013 RepID=A0A2C6VIU1_9STAP|nr:accessory Sec system glycosyltransferase GtfA [Staphylococcus edaphicus]PHK50141.1 accessory Sec system glycosyltransferase GtfA [Staphylococcus edaphicus]UQW81639.1 accessory Sec system glycosyltransferase GtfA [Staphylococcus edaphicus]
MTIYNINFGIGWASSGVEYAQAYRAKLLRQSSQNIKFVYLDFIQNENIQTLTSNMGFHDNEIIWLYQYFTDIKIAPTTFTIGDLKNTLGEAVIHTEQIDKKVRLFLNNEQTFVTCYLKNQDEPYVDRAEFVIKGILVRKDFYSYVRVFSEYYAPFENRAKIYMRQFYNEDGSIAYNEYVDGDESTFAFDDAKLYSKAEFVGYFIRRLQLTSKDMIILDRATKIGQAVLQHKGQSKIGVAVHAEHFSNNIMNDSHILWNSYYEYQFSNAKDIDFFITATDLQNKILSTQFQKYKGLQPKIYTIPVGSLASLQQSQNGRKPYAIITASRLASEKHIDWLVRAVIKAKQTVSKLTFDIYGEGGEKKNISDIILQHEAESYIRLLGHVKLDEVYSKYELFVSASTSEGFGLTLMEAVGSGLSMIGFDVNYGNQTFIKHNENGYLVPISLKEDSTDDIVERIAQYIIAYFEGDMANPHRTSYDIARDFLTPKIEQKWQNLIEEVLHD